MISNDELRQVHAHVVGQCDQDAIDLAMLRLFVPKLLDSFGKQQGVDMSRLIDLQNKLMDCICNDQAALAEASKVIAQAAETVHYLSSLPK